MNAEAAAALDHHDDHHELEAPYWEDPPGLWNVIKSWALTVDHKRIGWMYMVTVIAFFMVGGVLALGLPSGADVPRRQVHVGRHSTTSSSRCTARSWSSW